MYLVASGGSMGRALEIDVSLYHETLASAVRETARNRVQPPANSGRTAETIYVKNVIRK
jgi:tryptophanase